MRLVDLPADLLVHLLGRLNAGNLARAGMASGTLLAVVQRAAAHALSLLDGAAGTVVERSAGLTDLQQLRACEARFLLRFSTFSHRKFRGDLPPPEPSPSGCKFHECPELRRLESASRSVITGGELALESPLGSDCRLEYRYVIVNDGVPCNNLPSPGVRSFLYVRKVMEVFETFVPPHLRGFRVGDRLAQQAFEMVVHAINNPPEARLRPSCTFISGSFLRRHPTLTLDGGGLVDTASCLEFYSTRRGQTVTARRNALKALSQAELKVRCQQRGLATGFRKPALIESLIQAEFGTEVFLDP